MHSFLIVQNVVGYGSEGYSLIHLDHQCVASSDMSLDYHWDLLESVLEKVLLQVVGFLLPCISGIPVLFVLRVAYRGVSLPSWYCRLLHAAGLVYFGVVGVSVWTELLPLWLL